MSGQLRGWKRLTLLALLLVFAAGSIFLLLRHARLVREQAERERRSAALVGSPRVMLPAGTSRAESEQRMSAAGLLFGEAFGVEPHLGEPQAYQELVYLGRRPSGVWYCGPIQFGVLVSFDSQSLYTMSKFGPVPPPPAPNDLVRSIQPYELADDCL